MKKSTLFALSGAAIAAAVIAAALGMGRAQAAAKLTKLTLQLKWVPQAEFAGYYAAVAKGYYNDLGLNVTLKPGGSGIAPEQVVLAGKAQFGLDWLPNLLATRQKGGDIVSVAQIFARSGMTELTWKSSGIDSIQKMRGKKVGTFCCGNQWELFAALNKNGIDPNDPTQVTMVNQPFDMSLFLQHKIDAAAATTYDGLAQVLEATNPQTGKLYRLSDLNVLKMASPAVGTGMLEDTVFTTMRYFTANKKTIVKFLEGSYEGWIYCRDHVRDCVDIVLKADPALGRMHQLWQMNEVNKLLWPNPHGIGFVSDGTLAQNAAIAEKYGVINKAPHPFLGALAWGAADQALPALRAKGDDVTGLKYKPLAVTVTPGGK